MDDCKEKKLMEILAEKGKPYVKKHDGYAVKMEEDVQITYTDYNNTEMTFTVPKGSYIMAEEDSSYPKIVTQKEWDDSNKFLGEEGSAHEASETKEEEKKEEKKKQKFGLELLEE